ncbi:protein-disulfide reductase DsbD domain-containing protein [Yoonia sp.]|uniref:protein-disulfide reductase DsbD domain-containing protein n=1 Tax=Yoonia sp. TaxID=2212373 RepID=UPI0019E7D495|nr:protein-disulfide reductase DsbD domain-containing protein [Yoonia sp.]MBE0414435.1 hypothetical protein [Yoonia sp.]
MLKKLVASFALLCTPHMLPAQSYDNLAKIEVLPGWRMADGSHMAGLRITLQPGWKTYWRAPGDAGIPPHFSFEGSNNIGTVVPHWPVPEVFDQDGQRTIGYHDSVVFPLKIAATNTDAPLHMTGQIDIGVCEEICIPVSLHFDTLLPPEGKRDAAIVAALVNRPLTAGEATLGPVTCTIAQIADGLQVTASLALPETSMAGLVVIESGSPDVWVSEADITRTNGRLQATVDMVHISSGPFALDRSQLRMTLLGASQAIELQGCQGN